MVGAGHEWAEDGLCLGGETQIVRRGVGKWFEVVQNRHSAAPAFPSLPGADPAAQHRRPLRHKATDDAPAGRKHQLRHQQNGKVGGGSHRAPSSPERAQQAVYDARAGVAQTGSAGKQSMPRRTPTSSILNPDQR